MSKEPAGSPTTEREDPIDRFEHEMEELEHPMGGSLRQWVFGFIVALAVVGGIFVAAFFLNKSGPAKVASNVPVIEVSEPKRGALPAIPYVFRWDSISGTDSYLLRIQKEGSPMDLISRETKTAFVQLNVEERNKLGSGGKFTWVVQARAKYGKILAEGKSTFSF
jgi:hypothetical protein